MQTRVGDNLAQKRLDDLLMLLERLDRLHGELGDVLREKLQTMRRSDLDGIHACVHREQNLARRIDEQNGLRKQLTVKIGRAFGIAPETARAMTASGLAARVTDPYGERILDAAQRLKRTVVQVERTNRMVHQVSSRVLSHLHQVFSSIAEETEPADGYTPTGGTQTGQRRELFEAIG